MKKLVLSASLIDGLAIDDFSLKVISGNPK
jgi:hypothetical protein